MMDSEDLKLCGDYADMVDATEEARSKIVETIKSGINSPGSIIIEKDKIQVQIDGLTSFNLEDLTSMALNLSDKPLFFEFKLKQIKTGVLGGTCSIPYLIISEVEEVD